MQEEDTFLKGGKGKGKAFPNQRQGKGKKGKGKGKFPDNWVHEIWENGTFVPVCKRFHLDSCINPTCRFSHKCPVKDNSGKPCLGAHRAADHAPAVPRT